MENVDLDETEWGKKESAKTWLAAPDSFVRSNSYL